MNRRILVVEDQGITGKFCATCLESGYELAG